MNTDLHKWLGSGGTPWLLYSYFPGNGPLTNREWNVLKMLDNGYAVWGECNGKTRSEAVLKFRIAHPAETLVGLNPEMGRYEEIG